MTRAFKREKREILIVDDGSTNNTVELLKKYSNTSRYLRMPNGEQASAFQFSVSIPSKES